MIKRRKSIVIKIGNIKIGSNNPVAIQGMTKTDTEDTSLTIREIKKLEASGCELIRVAVKSINAAKSLKKIKRSINIPLIADIHFDYRLALSAIENGVDKIRINPGNMTKTKDLKEIIKKAKRFKIPIRLGLNSGSLPIKDTKKDIVRKLVSYALKYIKFFEKNRFYDIIVSLKTSDALSTIRANEEIAKRIKYPLHLGVTATGSSETALVKSALGIGVLLQQGIGDTIRVSLTSSSLKEIEAAKEILQALQIRKFAPEIISCPMCGRTQVDLAKIVKAIEKTLKEKAKKDDSLKNLKVAIMGCEVNGPGEAKMADVGVACGGNYAALFKKGKILRRIKIADIKEELICEVIKGDR